MEKAEVVSRGRVFSIHSPLNSIKAGCRASSALVTLSYLEGGVFLGAGISYSLAPKFHKAGCRASNALVTLFYGGKYGLDPTSCPRFFYGGKSRALYII